MSPRVLIIDDHPEFRDLLAHHISSEWPHSQILNHDHDRMPTVFERQDVDVILLDYRLGDASGLDWLRAMRAEGSCPPIIFLTVAGDELLAVKAIKAGAHDYLPKNRLTNEMLINSIRDARRSRSPLSRAASQPVATPLKAVSADVLRVRGYDIISEISERGHSAIYLAEHEGMQVALKVLRNAADIDGDKLERFLQECEVVTNLRHPNVVRIYDHGVADEVVYIAMEYFPRGDLKTHLRKGMSSELAMQCVREIAIALQAIHELGILHRDLKPANVMVREDHSLALIDFGHAKQMWLEAELTDTGEIFGTPYYMSPEQGQGEPIDEPSDIYSLGVMTYELLTGRKPYTAASPMAVIYKHAHAAAPQLPPALLRYQPMLAKMMAKLPADRYQSAGELLQKLDETSNIVDTSKV